MRGWETIVIWAAFAVFSVFSFEEVNLNVPRAVEVDLFKMKILENPTESQFFHSLCLSCSNLFFIKLLSIIYLDICSLLFKLACCVCFSVF